MSFPVHGKVSDDFGARTNILIAKKGKLWRSQQSQLDPSKAGLARALFFLSFEMLGCF